MHVADTSPVSRESLRYAIVALLGGTAIALAAATFPTRPAEGGPPFPGEGDGLGTFGFPVPEDGPAETVELPPFLDAVFGAVVVVAAVAALVYVLYNWRESLATLAQGAAIAVVVFLLYALLSRVSPGLSETSEFGIGDDEARGGGGDVGGESLVSTEPTPVAVLFVLLAMAAIVGVAVLYGRDADAGERSEHDGGETAAAVGRAAGRAADRIETADGTENEIYRAWAEMAGLVDAPDPGTKTTAEFADAAVESGLAADDVRDLTRLFERVRYGTDDPTPEAEQRAVELFRRIESTYAEES